jgi:hypothetical protein
VFIFNRGLLRVTALFNPAQPVAGAPLRECREFRHFSRQVSNVFDAWIQSPLSSVFLCSSCTRTHTGHFHLPGRDRRDRPGTRHGRGVQGTCRSRSHLVASRQGPVPRHQRTQTARARPDCSRNGPWPHRSGILAAPRLRWLAGFNLVAAVLREGETSRPCRLLCDAS